MHAKWMLSAIKKIKWWRKNELVWNFVISYEVRVRCYDERLINQYSSNSIWTMVLFAAHFSSVAFHLIKWIGLGPLISSSHSITLEFGCLLFSIRLIHQTSFSNQIHSIDAANYHFFLPLLYKLRYFQWFVIYKRINRELLTQSKRNTRHGTFSIHIILVRCIVYRGILYSVCVVHWTTIKWKRRST